MATASTRTDRRSNGDGGGPISRREARMAELVAGLAGCDDDVALDALGPHRDRDDPLEAVARALTGLRRETAEPQDRFRVAGFLRPAADRRLPRRPRAGGTAVADRADQRLVHHGSLRRWDRTDAEGAWSDTGNEALQGDEEAVIDLRDRTDRFRRPSPGGASGSR